MLERVGFEAAQHVGATPMATSKQTLGAYFRARKAPSY
jgi:hypothetical protein